LYTAVLERHDQGSLVTTARCILRSVVEK